MTFKAWSRALTSLAPLALLACSDPSPPIAQGGVHYETASNPIAGQCAFAGGYTAEVSGETAPNETDPGDRLVSGDNHAKVTCSVDGSGTVKFSGEIEGINDTDGHQARLSIHGQINEDGTGTADVTALVNGQTYSNSELCTLQGVTVNGEKWWGDDLVWTTFKCPSMGDGAPNNLCQTKGTIVLENCK